MNNKGFFAFIFPVIAAVGTWLTTASVGGVITLGLGSLVISWVIGNVVMPALVVLGLLVMGFIFAAYGLRDPQTTTFTYIKVGLGLTFFIFALASAGMFFSTKPFILFSMGGQPQALSLADGFTVQSFSTNTPQLVFPFNVVLALGVLFVFSRLPLIKRVLRR